jgi:hypothetical protein
LTVTFSGTGNLTFELPLLPTPLPASWAPGAGGRAATEAAKATTAAAMENFIVDVGGTNALFVLEELE